MAISLPLTPINSSVSRSAQTKTVAGLCGEISMGVSQFHRYGFSPSGGSGRIVLRSLVTRSTRFMRPSCDSEYITRLSEGSICATKPSPPPMTHQSSLAIPLEDLTALGPHQVLLSCRPAQTVYGILKS